VPADLQSLAAALSSVSRYLPNAFSHSSIPGPLLPEPGARRLDEAPDILLLLDRLAVVVNMRKVEVDTQRGKVALVASGARASGGAQAGRPGRAALRRSRGHDNGLSGMRTLSTRRVRRHARDAQERKQRPARAGR